METGNLATPPRGGGVLVISEACPKERWEKILKNVCSSDLVPYKHCMSLRQE